MKVGTFGKTHVYRFEGIGEAMDAVADKTVCELRQTEKVKWVGADIPDKEALLKKINQPWAKGLEVIEKMMRQLSGMQCPEVKSHVRRTRFSEDDGDELDLDRLRSGQPYWRKSQREMTSGSTEVTVMFDCGGHWQRKHDEFLWRGAAAIALTEYLEERGYRVELWMVYKTSDSHYGWNNDLLNGICVKKTGDPLDRSSLSMAVSSWYHRQGTLNLGETEAGELGYHLQARGRQMTPNAADLDRFSTDENRIYVADVYDFKAASSLIEHELKKLNERSDR